jgi:FtsZ-binding cell division protein ZapB
MELLHHMREGFKEIELMNMERMEAMEKASTCSRNIFDTLNLMVGEVAKKCEKFARESKNGELLQNNLQMTNQAMKEARLQYDETRKELGGRIHALETFLTQKGLDAEFGGFLGQKEVAPSEKRLMTDKERAEIEKGHVQEPMGSTVVEGEVTGQVDIRESKSTLDSSGDEPELGN